jgi:hypothetical protein
MVNSVTGQDAFLRDVIDLPKSVHAGDFKVALTDGFSETEARVAEYVVTDQLRQAFAKALSLVRAAVRDGVSHAAYLHGSFGSGKSHFLTVLHAVLNNHPAVRAKVSLQPVIANHDEWLRGKKFLMVPYHLVGATDIDSAVLGGYVATVRKLHPDQPTPAVYRADKMLVDAARQRDFLGDDARFAEWLGDGGVPAPVDDVDDVEDINGPSRDGWTTATLDRAFAAPAGDPLRDALVSTLLSGPMSSYQGNAAGVAGAFIPLENGLSVISHHAKRLGYDGLILFLDELILWLQAHMSEQQFVNNQVSKLVKLIESGDADRALPIVSFISRQRDLSKLVGDDVTGADVKNLEAQVDYLAGRFDVINLEDRNLPAIIKERVLKPKSEQARALLNAAFASIESTNNAVKDVLLDAAGATGADWTDFREVYPLSPALLNVLVALSGALQRERTGLKLLQEMLFRRREDFTVGQLIPLGDLWDVLADGTGEAFTDRLRREAEAAQRFYYKVRAYLLDKYGSEAKSEFIADDRIVKTLVLAALAPNVPALTRLTGSRLAALNHGSIRSRTVQPGSVVVSRLRDIQAEFGELRADSDADPVFTLHLSDLDIEPLLDAVGEQDSPGARRIWLKEQLWLALGVRDSDEFVCEREVVWRGTRRVAEFVFGNVRDSNDIPDQQFGPSVAGRVRFVLDYPFDVPGHHPSDDFGRVDRLRRDGLETSTVVWLPHFFSPQKSAQLGRLLKIRYLLDRDRLDDYAANLSADDRLRVRHQLHAQQDNLTSQLSAALQQLYGIARVDEGTVGAMVGDDGHVLSLLPGLRLRLHAGAGFEYNVLSLADDLFAAMYPKHPNFDPTDSRKAITSADLRAVFGWINRAMEDGKQRVVVDRSQLALVKRIVHPLELGEVSDGPLNLSTEWRRRIEQYAAGKSVREDFGAEDIRTWIGELGYTGLDKAVSNLVIASYALLADRAWVLHGSPVAQAPELDRIGPGYALRAQRLPSAEEFATARQRAAELFGLHVPDVLFARNVGRLAAELRAKAEELEPAVHGVRRALDKHAEALGLKGSDPAPRVDAARDAADLLARLTRTKDATPVITELASAHYEITDQVLGAAIVSAPEVLAGLETTAWQLFDSVRRLTGRTDGIGDRADRLVEDVHRTAVDNEFHRPLAVVLREIQPRAVALLDEAVADQTPKPSGLAAPLTPTDDPVTETTPTAVAPPTAGPPSASPDLGRRAGSVHKVRTSMAESRLAAALGALQAEISDYARTNPDVEIVIDWRVVADEGTE